MSRVAKNPISVPSGSEVQLQGQQITIKGKNGHLEHTIHPDVAANFADKVLTFAARKSTARAIAGTTRALVANMVQGVTQGFERKLILTGVGYRAQVQGNILNLSLGFSHPVNFPIPAGITIETPSQTEIAVKGIDKQRVGQIAANIRAYRPPEPYKGKGIKYANEEITLKETKKK